MITRAQAAEIVRALLRAEGRADTGPEITDGIPDGCCVYNAPTNCWSARLSLGIHGLLCSSRLICISKDDGRVLYDGSAEDEG